MNQLEIIQEVSVLYSKAQSIYPALLNKAAPNVSFYTKGTSAGKAQISKNIVLFNIEIAKANPVEFKNTVSHEVAHIVQYFLFPFSSPHGREFQKIHRSLGGTGKRTHAMKVPDSARRNKTLHIYKCVCSEYALSNIKHSKATNLRTIYSCRKCNTMLKYSSTKNN